MRWAALTTLLLAEVLGLTLWFDAYWTRVDDHGWPGRLVFHSPQVLKVGLVAGIAVVVLGAWLLRGELRRAAPEMGTRRGVALWLAAHLVAFAGFVGLTVEVLGEHTRGSVLSPGPVVAWVLIGILSISLWAAAAIPPRLWPRLLWHGRAILLMGLGVGCAAQVAGQLVEKGWDVLGQPTLWSSYYLLRVISPDAACDPQTMTLSTPRFGVVIMPACSGYEGMGLITVYIAGYLWLFRRDLRFPRALVLWPLGLMAIWLTNVVRIATLVWLGDRVSPELALGGFHSQAGWLGFNAVALGLVYLAHCSRLLSAHAADTTSRNENPTAEYLAPFLAALAAQMLTTAFVTDAALHYPIRVAAAAAVLCYFWPRSAIANSAPGGTSGTGWGVAVGMAVFLVWVGLDRLLPLGEPADSRAALSGLAPWAAAVWFGVKVVGFVVVTPIAEELAFRGYLMRRLISVDFVRVPVGKFTWLSFVAPSVLFGLLHGQWLAGTLAGMAYAAVVYRTGRLRDAIVAHGVTNALQAALALSTGDWRWWA
ncbi:MAG TPA: exosortase E/protease, VPEID-CTERM system [Gemmataceae bacterium]|nr:exosortase E/protease, VPEID-CTERM system [Gemmataceae bacterium]